MFIKFIIFILYGCQGTNAEQGYIGGAICAERAALVRLRLYSNPVILKVVIVTDSVNPVAPGVMCREFLLSHAHPDTEIVLGGCVGEVINVCKLGQLYPHPYVYRHQPRDRILEYAKNYASTVCIQGATRCDDEVQKLHKRALAVIQYDDATSLHPIQFAAGVLYQNGDIEVTWMLKALEYGNTLDPVSQLVVGMERRRVECLSTAPRVEVESTEGNGPIAATSNSRLDYFTPKIILMTDQFGVCHAPFAMARSILSEHNYGAVSVVVGHMPDSGYEMCRADALAPPSPSGDLPLTPEDFEHMCCL